MGQRQSFQQGCLSICNAAYYWGIEVKKKIKVIPALKDREVKTYWGMEVKSQACLASAMDEGESSVWRWGRFDPGKQLQSHILLQNFVVPSCGVEDCVLQYDKMVVQNIVLVQLLTTKNPESNKL